MISIIVAMGKNRTIGKNGAIPWKLPADVRHFKETTMGHAVVMGRKTHESIGKALPGRKNIVITRQQDYSVPECIVVHSLDEALQTAKEDVFVIGGEEIYREAMLRADKLYVTLIDQNFDGDARFPEIDTSIWHIVDRKEGVVDEKNLYPHRFLMFERVQK